MRALFLSTSSNETQKYSDSLACLNLGPVSTMVYDTPDTTDANLFGRCKDISPDVIVYIGSRWGPQPATSTLAQINNLVAPMVHLCSDAADPPWWDLLREYHGAGAFAVTVAIDGNSNWPLHDSQLTLLTPIDPKNFSLVPRPHAERQWAAAYAGNPGGTQSARRGILHEFAFRNLLRFRMRDGGMETYPDYCRFVEDTRLMLNIPYSGTESAMQVKGRVVEVGMGGGCLLEVADSPTGRWFQPRSESEPGEFLAYETVEEAVGLIEWAAANPEEVEAMGLRLRERVLAEHSPKVFWGKVLARV